MPNEWWKRLAEKPSADKVLDDKKTAPVPAWVTAEALQRRRTVEQEPRAAFFHELSVAMDAPDPFPASSHAYDRYQSERKDEKKLQTQYRGQLEPYHFNEPLHEGSDKTDEAVEGSGGQWKFHLNVYPEHVGLVSGYLKQNRYRHKYLFGGELVDGKVFTLYIGSRDLARKLANQLSQDLGNFLQRPVVKQELEIAPNVSGRFYVDEQDVKHEKKIGRFTKYPSLGMRGIPTTLQDFEVVSWTGKWKGMDPDERRSVRDAALKNSFARLADYYGEYFFGKA